MALEDKTDKCDRCGRAKSSIDGYCEDCHEKLMETWEQEMNELNKSWRDTRL